MVILRIFKTVWFFSMVAGVGSLLYGYASLQQENVEVFGNGSEMTSISRDSFFYIVLAFLALINVMVYIIAKILAKNTEFRTWFYGLIITFNIFAVVGVSFVALYNSGEAYNFARLELVIYGSIALFLLWTLSWPVYLGYRKFSGQS